MAKTRASTQGCTEWSCMYHGNENRYKSAHEKECPIREFDGFIVDVFENPGAIPQCTCEVIYWDVEFPGLDTDKCPRPVAWRHSTTRSDET